MLIDSPIALVAACTAGSAALNLTMMKVSPGIKDGVRHLFAAAGPTVGALGAMVGFNESVVAYGSDIATLGAALVGGVAATLGSTRFVRPTRKSPDA